MASTLVLVRELDQFFFDPVPTVTVFSHLVDLNSITRVVVSRMYIRGRIRFSDIVALLQFAGTEWVHAATLKADEVRRYGVFDYAFDKGLETPATGPIFHISTIPEVGCQMVGSSLPSSKERRTQATARLDLEGRRLPCIHVWVKLDIVHES